MALRNKDGTILGLVAGLLMTTPAISLWVATQIGAVIPSEWLVLGTYSIPIFGAGAGALIGYLVDRS